MWSDLMIQVAKRRESKEATRHVAMQKDVTLFLTPLSPAPRSSLKHSSLVLGILYKFKLLVHEYVVFVFLFSGTQWYALY